MHSETSIGKAAGGKGGQVTRKCEALDWDRSDKDYVECDGSEVRGVTLDGGLLKVPAELCGAHRKVVAARRGEWSGIEMKVVGAPE